MKQNLKIFSIFSIDQILNPYLTLNPCKQSNKQTYIFDVMNIPQIMQVIEQTKNDF